MTLNKRPINRVVLISSISPNERDYHRHGVAFFLSQGIKILWLDVKKICHPTLKLPDINKSLLEKVNIRRIQNISELNDEVQNLKSADLIFALFTDGSVTRNNYPVFRLISRSNIPYILLMNDSFPGINQYKGEIKSIHKRVAHIVSRLRSIDWKTSLLSRLPFSWLGLRQADFVIHGGRKSIASRTSIGKNTQRILIHAHDYENYRNDREQVTNDTNTAVFIDQDIFQHQDFIYFTGSSLGDPEKFYQELNSFFDRIEHELGLQVIIAAHPRSEHHNNGNPFAGRKIILGETQHLIKKCKLAMTLTSQAMNYAILYNKPLAILSNNEFYQHPCGQSYQDPMAKSIGKSVYFLEDAKSLDLSSILAVNNKLYNRFIDDYIKTPDSDDTPLWEGVIRKINQHKN